MQRKITKVFNKYLIFVKETSKCPQPLSNNCFTNSRYVGQHPHRTHAHYYHFSCHNSCIIYNFIVCAWFPLWLLFVQLILLLLVLFLRYICKEEWPTAEQNYYYTLALLTLQFIVPLSVLIFTYTRIALAVWGKRPPGEAENSRDQRMARSKRKVS